MSVFHVLLMKEVKDLLRDPRVFIPFVISALILPIIGVVVSQGIQQSIQAVIAQPVVSFSLVNLDNGTFSQAIIEILKSQQNYQVYISDNLMDAIKHSEITVVIPRNFTESMTRYLAGQGGPPKIVVIQRVDSLGMGVELARAQIGAATISNVLKAYIASLYNVSQGLFAALQNPVMYETAVYITPRHSFLVEPTEQALSMISIPLFMFPLIIVIIGATVLQMAATSMALENEVRTLETLLTFPISRTSILMAKIGGSFIVGLIGGAMNIAGLMVYISIVQSSFSQSVQIPTTSSSLALAVLREFGVKNIMSISSLIVPEPSYIMVLCVSAVISILFLAVLGVLVGVLSSDVRIAGTFSGPLMMPLIIVAYIVGMIDVTKLDPTTQFILLSIPFSQTPLIAKYAMLNIWSPIIGIAIPLSLVFPLGLLIVTAKMLSIETLAKIHYTLSRMFRRRVTQS